MRHRYIIRVESGNRRTHMITRLGETEAGVRASVRAEYPDCLILSCQKMFQKGDPK